MARVIFRRIRGMLVPIKIGSESGRIAKNPANYSRKITAKIDGKPVGTMSVVSGRKDPFVEVVDTYVRPKFRKAGISGAMFEHAQKIYGAVGKKTIRTREIRHEAQVRIREVAGKTKFLGFIGWGMSKASKIDSHQAAAAAKEIRLGKENRGYQYLSATTMIPKKFRRK